MTLVLIEGFDHMAGADLPAKGWSSANVNIDAGRLGGNSLRLQTTHSSTLTKLLPSSYSTIIAGFAFKFLNIVETQTPIFQFRNSGAVVATLQVVGTNLVVKNSSGTTIATGTTTLLTTTWYYVELKIVVAGAGGSCAVQLNGVSEIATTTGNFGSTNANEILLGHGGGNTGSDSTDMDDVYVLNGAVSPNTTFLGDVRVETIFPDGDGAHTQWTPDSGSPHFSRVDETTPDGDASYVADGTVGDRDSYTFGGLASLLGTVFGVQKNVYARKDDAGTRQICAVTRPTTVDHDGPTKTLSTSYQFFSDIEETNPDTSSAWTISDVDGAEFGVKVVA